MSKISLTDLVNLQNETTAVNAINTNNEAIETSFDNTLSRNGSIPNQMNSSLDMNSNKILNLPAPISGLEPLRLVDAQNLVISQTPGAVDSNVFSTVSAATLANIAVGITTLRTLGYTAAGDGGGGLYTKVGSDPGVAGKFQSADGAWWKLSINSGMVNPRQLGAKGDGVTDDYAAILLARDICWANNKTLGFTDGTYNFSTTLEFARNNFCVLALGSNVILHHTGSGNAVSFDGNTAAGANSFNQVLGGENTIRIVGNSNTTAILYNRLVHHSKFNANVRDGTYGVQADSIVCSEYNIRCSSSDGTFIVVPSIGFFTQNFFSTCPCNLIIEGVGSVGNAGVILQGAFGCTITGTSENNFHGGVFIDTFSFSNTFIGFATELNGTGADFYVAGNSNAFIGCYALLTGIVTVAGTSTGNSFINCKLEGMTVQGGATNTSLEGCNLVAPFLDGGTGTVIRRCTGVRDNNTLQVSVVNGSNATIAPAGTGYYTLTVVNISTGSISSWLLNNGTVIASTLTGEWVASTTTPAAGKASVAFGGSYAVYNNTGSTATFNSKFTSVL